MTTDNEIKDSEQARRYFISMGCSHFNIDRKDKEICFIDIIYWLAIIGADVLIYMILGVFQMDYDDNYNSSKGEYWSLASMNKRQLTFYFALQLWNIINIIGLMFIGRKIYKRVKYVHIIS